jgi:hypothetical protein
MKLIEFTEHFSNEESCEQYLKEVREKQGVVCTKCGGTAHYWNKASKSWICKHCHHQTTLTSGTVMHGSNLPLRYYFGDKIFDRLMIASVTYKPDFEHKIYNKKMRLC